MPQKAATRGSATWLLDVAFGPNAPRAWRAASTAPRRLPERASSQVAVMDVGEEAGRLMPALSRFAGAKRTCRSRKVRISIGFARARLPRLAARPTMAAK